MLYMPDYSVNFVEQAKQFTSELDAIAYAKVMKSATLFYRYGGNLGYPHSKKIHVNLFELRIPGHPAVRLFYTVKQQTVIIFYGFYKKTNKLPRKELQMALKLLASLG